MSDVTMTFPVIDLNTDPTKSPQLAVRINVNQLAVALEPLLLQPPGSSPPPAVNSSAGSAYVYHDGVLDPAWGLNMSWGVNVNPSFPDSAFGKVLRVTGNGGWQPGTSEFDPSVYTHLQVSLRPTLAGQKWGAGVMAVGDKPVGETLSDLTPFALSRVQPGEWTTFLIPLGASGLKIPYGAQIYKFWLQDRTNNGKGTANNVWDVAEAAFEVA